MQKIDELIKDCECLEEFIKRSKLKECDAKELWTEFWADYP